jgi:CRISPR/Cas system-associated exonuclease Cas4 (RecB family)
MEDLIKRIDDAIIARADSRASRKYLGASSLGEVCDRKLWYSFHQPTKILDARVNRIFDLGNLIEDYLVKLLRDAGYTVHDKDEEGKQFGFEDGIIAGNSDGVIVVDGVPMLLEFKSYNTKRFAELKKSGVQSSDPKYYGQVNVYMKYLELDQCLFIAMDKNTSELYFQTVKYDPIEAHYLVNRGKGIAEELNVENISKKYSHISSFGCKFCDYRKICWRGDEETISKDT